MARSRRFRKPRRRFHRRRRPSAKKIAYKALRASKTEMKHIDAAQGLTLGKSTGDVINLNGISGGANSDQRTANKVKYMSYYIRLRAENSANVGATTAVCRMMIVMDRQQVKATAPTIADVLGAGFGIEDPLNITNLGRYKVYMDKTFFIGLPATGVDIKLVKRWVPIRKTIQWSDANGANIIKNGLYLMVYFEAQALAADFPNWSYHSRITYSDQ